MNFIARSTSKINSTFTLYLMANVLLFHGAINASSNDDTCKVTDFNTIKLFQEYNKSNISPETVKLALMTYCKEYQTCQPPKIKPSIPAKTKYQDWVLSGWTP